MVDLLPATAVEIAKTAIAFVLILFIVVSCVSPLLSNEKYYKEAAIQNFDMLIFNINVLMQSNATVSYKQVTMTFPSNYYVYAFNAQDPKYYVPLPSACKNLACICLFNDKFDDKKQINNEQNAIACQTLSYTIKGVKQKIAIAPSYLQAIDNGNGPTVVGTEKYILLGSGQQFSTSMMIALSKKPGTLVLADQQQQRTIPYDMIIGSYPGTTQGNVGDFDPKDPSCPQEQTVPCGTTSVKVQVGNVFFLNHCVGMFCANNQQCTKQPDNTYACANQGQQQGTTTSTNP